MTTPYWPVFASTAEGFYSGPLARPRSLLKEFTATGGGSGRRSGPRDLLWQAVAAQAVAALEAGLEDIFLAEHAVRQSAEAQPVRLGLTSPDKNPRPWLVEARLMAPGPVKIERLLFSDFGVVLGDPDLLK